MKLNDNLFHIIKDELKIKYWL